LASLGGLAAVDDEGEAADEMEPADRIVAGRVWRAMNHGKSALSDSSVRVELSHILGKYFRLRW
jgi:hypothetical protein